MTAPSPTLVTSVEDLTPAWLTAVLRSAGHDGVDVSDVAVAPIGGGALSSMVRAELTYAGGSGGPSSVVVKFPAVDPGSLGLAQSMGMYELEVRFYQDVAPLLKDLSLPRCLASVLDTDTGLFTLVLEDVSGHAAPQANVGQDTDPAESEAACARALAELVRLQAPLWNSPQLSKLDWLADNSRAVGLFEAMSQGLAPFLARFGHGLDAEHVAFFETYLPRSADWVRSWTTPTVLQHGDFRSDNLMIGTSAGAPPVTVIDFQTVRLGPPGVDAAYLVGSTLPTEQRRERERELVRGWAAGLAAAGVQDFDDDAAWDSYRAGALYGAFLFVGLASQVVSSPEIDQFIAAQARRYADMAIDLDAVTVAGLA